MTLDESKIKDWRSTGRRKGRRVLYKARVEYCCAFPGCGVTTIEPPSDAPVFFDEIWPTHLRVLTYPLQVNHITKDLTQNEESVLEWLCAPHHKLRDSQTGVGESTMDEAY